MFSRRQQDAMDKRVAPERGRLVRTLPTLAPVQRICFERLTNFAMRTRRPRSGAIGICRGVLRVARLEKHQAQIRVVTKFVMRLIKRCKQNRLLLPNVSHFRAQVFEFARWE
jgi:hypothetical protein